MTNWTNHPFTSCILCGTRLIRDLEVRSYYGYVDAYSLM